MNEKMNKEPNQTAKKSVVELGNEWLLNSCFELQSLDCVHLSSYKDFQVLGKSELSFIIIKAAPSPYMVTFYALLFQRSKHILMTVFSMDLFVHIYLFFKSQHPR